MCVVSSGLCRRSLWNDANPCSQAVLFDIIAQNVEVAWSSLESDALVGRVRSRPQQTEVPKIRSDIDHLPALSSESAHALSQFGFVHARKCDQVGDAVSRNQLHRDPGDSPQARITVELQPAVPSCKVKAVKKRYCESGWQYAHRNRTALSHVRTCASRVLKWNFHYSVCAQLLRRSWSHSRQSLVVHGPLSGSSDAQRTETSAPPEWRSLAAGHFSDIFSRSPSSPSRLIVLYGMLSGRTAFALREWLLRYPTCCSFSARTCRLCSRIAGIP